MRFSRWSEWILSCCPLVGTSEERAMKMVTGGSCALLLALTTHGHVLKAASSCESLSSLALPNTSITLAKTVAAGAFTLPETGPAVPQFSQLPTFCRVAAYALVGLGHQD